MNANAKSYPFQLLFHFQFSFIYIVQDDKAQKDNQSEFVPRIVRRLKIRTRMAFFMNIKRAFLTELLVALEIKLNKVDILISII